LETTPARPLAPSPAVASASARTSLPTSGPWWKYKLVWMVWAGPALVVVASLLSFGLAAGKPDDVVTAPGAHLTPARTARNHAATSRELPHAPTPAHRPAPQR
jgi:uncharacterized protein